VKETDFVEAIVKEVEKVPKVKRVEVVPVCEIFVDACLKVIAESKEVKPAVADAVHRVASRFQERLGKYPEIYWDLEVEP
jgi:hypothetical protein